MIQISSPQGLFGKQKLFNISNVVEKNKSAGIQVKDGKEIAIFYSIDKSEKPEGEEQTQLLKILAACKLKEEDVILVNTAFATNTSLSDLRNQYPIHTVICFGDLPLSKNMNMKMYRAYSIDGLQMVKSDALNVLIKKDDSKKALWLELKKMFGIS